IGAGAFVLVLGCVVLIVMRDIGVHVDQMLDSDRDRRWVRIFVLVSVYGGLVLSIAWVLVIGGTGIGGAMIGVLLIAVVLSFVPAAVIEQLEGKSFWSLLDFEKKIGLLTDRQYRIWCVGPFSALLLLVVIGAGMAWRLVRIILEWRPVAVSYLEPGIGMYAIAGLLPLWAIVFMYAAGITGWAWGHAGDRIMEGSSLR
ncbi:MAG: hypothetical protein MUP66_02910, partial [Candidatus Nanohaloarchaeota archaeon QJJ-5]|nr:hypothetical protein [Candidatus Nanohaloarchaeota archaeon QJJ-5]